MSTGTTHELAWAAGLYDGEGCTTLAAGKRARDYPTPRAQVTQQDPTALHRFAAAVACGSVTGPTRGNTCHDWRANGEAAYHTLILLWPWLSEPKREQARHVLHTWNQSLLTRRAYGSKLRAVEVP